MWGFGPFGFFHAWWTAASSLFWLAVVVLVVVAVSRGSRHPGNAFWRGSGALDILEQRYARGEIDRDEYLEKKRDLTDRGPAG